MTDLRLRPAGPLRPELRQLISRLDPDGERMVADLFARSSSATVLITPDVVDRVVRSFAWLLDRVGDDGIALTSSGYLPPAVVREAMHVIGDEHWIGTANREHHTAPVLDLRESAMRFGLLRRRKGQLLLAPAGRALRGDPAGLFVHLAQSAPDAAEGPERDAGWLVLVGVVAGASVTFEAVDRLVVRGLTSLGWSRSDGPLRRFDGYGLARGTLSLLRATGGLEPSRGDEDRCTEAGRAFARAALREPG